MTKDEQKAFKMGLLQLGLQAFVYILWAMLGFITSITIGFIIPIATYAVWIQGMVLILTSGMGVYQAYGLGKDS